MAYTRVDYNGNWQGQSCIGRLGATRAGQAWIIAEIGSGKANGGPNQGGKFNPFGCTLVTPDSVLPEYNSAGVQNYGTFAGGIKAMVAMIHQQNFAEILTVMRTPGVSEEQIFEAIDASQWGTHLAGLQAGLAAYMGNRGLYDELSVGT